MNINRTIQPPFQNIDSIKLIEPEKIILDNSIPLYTINAGTQEVLKIDLSFDAGSWYQTKPLISTTVNEMLSEGTSHLTSKEIAEKLFLSAHTVITHRKNITTKLGIKTISGLTVYAILNNIISIGDLE